MNIKKSFHFCSVQTLPQARDKEFPLLEPEVLQVHAPPFVSKQSSSDGPSHTPAFSRIQKRRSFMKKKRERAATPPSDPAKGNGEPSASATVATTEDVSVPKDIDLNALPQLCFPGDAPPPAQEIHTSDFVKQGTLITVQNVTADLNIMCSLFMQGVLKYLRSAERTLTTSWCSQMCLGTGHMV